MNASSIIYSSLQDKSLSVFERLQKKIFFSPDGEARQDQTIDTAGLPLGTQHVLRDHEISGQNSRHGEKIGRAVTVRSSASKNRLSTFFHDNRSRPEHSSSAQPNELCPESRPFHSSGGEHETDGGEMDVDFARGKPFWLRRAVSATFGRRRRRRPSSSTMSSVQNTTTVDPWTSDSGAELLSPPLNPSGGAAARAAAAAQNEMLESARYPTLHGKSRLVEPKITNDSESGIGIELREPSDDMDFTLPVTRTGD